MAESIMPEKAKDFAVEIVNTCREIKEKRRELLCRTDYLDVENFNVLRSKSGNIRRMLISSINTVKSNMNQ